jgi:hypothetical protein
MDFRQLRFVSWSSHRGQWQSTTSEDAMHKNANRRRARLVLSRETVRRLSAGELRIAHGGVVTYETVTDEMGVCCRMSPEIPCA